MKTVQSHSPTQYENSPELPTGPDGSMQTDPGLQPVENSNAALSGDVQVARHLIHALDAVLRPPVFRGVLLASLALVAAKGTPHADASPVRGPQATELTGHGEMAKSRFAIVPGFPADTDIPDARTLLRHAGFTHVGIRPDKKGRLPKAQPGYELIATGVSKKVVRRTTDKKGRAHTVVSYPLLKRNSKQPTASRVYINTRPHKLPDTNPPILAPVNPPVQNPIVDIPKTPDVPPIPETITDPLIYMEHYTAYLGSSGCSGEFEADALGTIRVVSSASHCYPGERTLGSNGEYYLNIGNKPLAVGSGNSLDNLSSKGEVTKFLISKTDDKNSDFAIGIIGDTTVQKAIETHRLRNLTKEQVQQLTPGQPVFISGFPGIQPGNNTGVLRRETWTATLLSTDAPGIRTTAGKEFDSLAMVGINESADGSLATNGSSGASALVKIVKHNPDGSTSVDFKSIGNNVANYDLRRNGRNVYGYTNQEIDDLEAWIKQTTGVDVSNYDGVVYFSSAMPVAPVSGATQNFDVVNLVRSN